MWKRVIAPTVWVSTIWVIVSLATSYYMNRLFDAGYRAITENVTTIDSAWEMRRDTWKLQVAILETAYQNRQEMERAVTQLESSFLRSLEDANKTSLTATEQNSINQIRQRFDLYRTNIHQQLQARAAAPESLPSTSDREQAIRLATGVSDACRVLSEFNEQLINDATAQTRRMQTTLYIVRLSFLIIGPLIGLLLGLLVARRLNRSIARISVTLNDASGEMPHDLGTVAVSITEDLPALQKQSEIVADRIRDVVERLDEARRRAVQSERLAAVGELAAGVAHEIRNPLTSVKLLIQTAAERQPEMMLNEKQSTIVLQEIGRMETLIQELLDFARPPRLRVVRHDLRQTVRRALTLVEGRAQQQKVEIVEDFPQSPVFANCDPEQLHLVFVNLAINGLEAMRGGGTLRVSFETNENACRIIFCDTGSGIAPQIYDRLFEPFVTSKDRGTGLGLAIARRIVLEHHGTLAARNRADCGAMFTVELQLDAGESQVIVPDSLPAIA